MPTESEIKKKLGEFLQSTQEPSLEGWIAMGIALLLNKQDEGYEYNRLMVRGDAPDVVKDITAFQEKYMQTYSGPPRQLPPEYAWRTKFLEEEGIVEYKEALESGDIVKQCDALLDSMFVILGTLYLQGFPIARVWNELCRSNMTKECVPLGQGKFGATVHKGKGFSPIRLEEILYPLIDPEWESDDDRFWRGLEDEGWMPESIIGHAFLASSTAYPCEICSQAAILHK